MIAEPRTRVSLAEQRAVVLAGAAARARIGKVAAAEAFARQVVRAARVSHVLVEGHALRESLRSHCAGHGLLLSWMSHRSMIALVSVPRLSLSRSKQAESRRTHHCRE